MPFINKTIRKLLWREAVWEKYISKTVQIATNVNIINRETIAYLFYEKQKLTIMWTWMEKILLIISNFVRAVKPLLSDKIKSSEKNNIGRTKRNSWYG